jgi:hypothetical protein
MLRGEVHQRDELPLGDAGWQGTLAEAHSGVSVDLPAVSGEVSRSRTAERATASVRHAV